jgi:DNA mismatch endonuclease, patch repair protein
MPALLRVRRLMADIVNKATRSRMMAGIKGKDTSPELQIRRVLHSHGFRYRLHVKTLPGKPDIVLPKYRTAIFVHGCFWHQHPGCKRAVMPASNARFWKVKLDGNTRRDVHNIRELERLGWQCLVVWECELNCSTTQKHLIRNVQQGLSRPNPIRIPKLKSAGRTIVG